MHIILGGTGHVGASVTTALLEKGEKVTVVTHDEKKVDEWEKRGAKTAVVDVLDSGKLHEVFRTGTRLFLLNPPAMPSTDTVAEEQKTLSSILKALEESGIEKVVAESTYGAQPGEGVGDLGVLFEMEERLEKMDLSATIIRAAYCKCINDDLLKLEKFSRTNSDVRNYACLFYLYENTMPHKQSKYNKYPSVPLDNVLKTIEFQVDSGRIVAHQVIDCGIADEAEIKIHLVIFDPL